MSLSVRQRAKREEPYNSKLEIQQEEQLRLLLKRNLRIMLAINYLHLLVVMSARDLMIAPNK